MQAMLKSSLFLLLIIILFMMNLSNSQIQIQQQDNWKYSRGILKAFNSSFDTNRNNSSKIIFSKPIVQQDEPIPLTLNEYQQRQNEENFRISRGESTIRVSRNSNFYAPTTTNTGIITAARFKNTNKYLMKEIFDIKIEHLALVQKVFKLEREVYRLESENGEMKQLLNQTNNEIQTIHNLDNSSIIL